MTERNSVEKLHYGRTCCIGLAFMGISAFWQLYDNIIPLILKNTFTLGDTATGVVMALDNVFAVALLPLLGAWSDRTYTRFGKRTPFIVAGTLLSVASMMLIPLADTTRNLMLFIIGLAMTLFSMSLYRSPAVALMPDLTPPHLRSQGNAVINVMGALGAICTLILIKVLVNHEATPDYTPLFTCIAGIMICALVLLLITVRERRLSAAVAKEYADHEPAGDVNTSSNLSPEIKRSLSFALSALVFYYMAYNGVTTAFSRYAQVVWGLNGGDFAVALMVVALSAFLSYIPLGIAATKLGRRNVIRAGFSLMTISFVAITFINEYHTWVNVLFVVVGVGGSAVGVNIFPVIVDMCDNSKLGKYTGLYYAFSMSAQIITPIASGFLLEHVSYLTLFPYAAAFSLLGIASMKLVCHGDLKPPKHKHMLDALSE